MTSTVRTLNMLCSVLPDTRKVKARCPGGLFVYIYICYKIRVCVCVCVRCVCVFMFCASSVCGNDDEICNNMHKYASRANVFAHIRRRSRDQRACIHNLMRICVCLSSSSSSASTAEKPIYAACASSQTHHKKASYHRGPSPDT